MTKKSIFQQPKIVLVFNHQRILVSMHKSVNLASQEMNLPAQSISLCCLGNNISCYGYYFRHYDPNVVEIVPHLDFGDLQLEEFDRMSKIVRRYHDEKELNRRALSAVKRRNNRTDKTHE